mmetsp:Transcript_4210/g.11625  ORF Transcript_4210/g.11625 Transcript_4210/m.11625 type:complete len:232 (-) Transcript_4210:88-783(-)
MQAKLEELVPRILRGKALDRTSSKDVREEAEDRLGLARGDLDGHREALTHIISGWVKQHFHSGKEEPPSARKRQRADLAQASLSGWRELWESRRFPDAVVRCGGRAFEVHRAVLGARSPVMNAIFSQEGLREACERRLNIEDAQPEAVEAMLRYMYLGEVTEDCDYAALLRLADQYEVEGLPEICAQALLQSISTETVVTSLCALRTHRGCRPVADAYERWSAGLEAGSLD